MKFSQLYVKTKKNIDQEIDSANARYLEQGGFIDRVMAGVYTFLPLGIRVLQKIENIIRREMDKIGVEIFMPAIVPTDLWDITHRRQTVDVLFQVNGANPSSVKKNPATYILNSTHEEVITPLAKKYIQSYKDLPAAYYQIQTKFRNEARPKSGLLRAREFRMKDLYSFHVSEQDLLDYYHNVAKQAYIEIYKKLGIGDSTVIALASGGDFTKENSHEFQTICESGEDTLFYDAKQDIYYNKEIAPSRAPVVDWDVEAKPMEEIYGEHITGMDALVDFLKVPAEKCMKTVIYETDDMRVIAAGIRGCYEINELKLKQIVDCKSLQLASEETIKRVTGAEIGYAGVVNLADEVEVFIDDSLEDAVNFECGGNKTYYHNINVNWDVDVKKPAVFYDFKVAQRGDLNPQTGSVYDVFTASEVGNIFPLMKKFSEPHGLSFIDQIGVQQPVYMGCYGIGSSRVMGVIVEKYHDDKGIIWPKQVAPYTIHLLSIGKDETVIEHADALYHQLLKHGIEVLYDDRLISPGQKLADADLIGIPLRILLSPRTLEKGDVEWKERSQQDAHPVPINEVVLRVIDWIRA